jgi:hypothetical protein
MSVSKKKKRRRIRLLLSAITATTTITYIHFFLSPFSSLLLMTFATSVALAFSVSEKDDEKTRITTERPLELALLRSFVGSFARFFSDEAGADRK